MEEFQKNSGTLKIEWHGRVDEAGQPRLVLLHGWGQPGRSLLPLVTTLQNNCAIATLDTPGNGIAPNPPSNWGMDDYQALVEGWLATLPEAPTVFVCHSFGCRLAMRMAAKQPAWLKGIAVVGGHGLKPIRPLHRQIKVLAIRYFVKTMGFIDRQLGTGLRARYVEKLGSADYRRAGEMRPVFVRIVSDDVSALLNDVKVPVLLLYGEYDGETPPVLGRRFHALLPNSEFHELAGQDHYSVIGQGAQASRVGIVATYVKEFIKKVM